MSGKKKTKMNEKKKITIEELEPAFLLDCVDEINDLVNANVKILESVKSLIKRGVAHGMNEREAGAIALELHKRAAAKANGMVKYDEESKAATDEESKAATDEESKAATDEESKAATDEESKAATDEESKAATDEESKAATDEESKAATDEESKAATDEE